MYAEFVAPVVDYEPPVFGGPPVLPPVTPPRPRCAAPVRPTRRAPAEAGQARAAASFADAALRRVLEVIDRRRPRAQLRPLLAEGLLNSLPGRAAGAEPARLRRVVARCVDEGGTAAEVAASYSRGDRVHAIACRVQLIPGPTGARWMLVALHLG